MSIEAFFNACASHDWFYSFSDDYSVYCRGEEAYDRLKAEAVGNDQKTACLHDWQAYMFSGEAFGKPKADKPVLSDYKEIV